MSSPSRVLIAGAGVAAFEATLAIREAAGSAWTSSWSLPRRSSGTGRSLSPSRSASARFGRSTCRSSLRKPGRASPRARSSPSTPVAHVAYSAAGAELGYDVLLVATGASPRAAVAGALTFRGPADIELIRTLLHELDRGDVRRVAVAVPLGAVWALPAYELALLIAAYVTGPRIEDAQVVLVTPEEKPLQLFGSVGERGRDGAPLRARHHTPHTRLRDGSKRRAAATGSGRIIAADRVVALPRLYGPPIDGIPQTRDGFIIVDEQSRVAGFRDVFAAGDVTSFPVKQGGIAAQQADAAAEAIAAAWAPSPSPAVPAGAARAPAHGGRHATSGTT